MNKSGILAIILLTLYVLYYYFYVVEQFTNNTVVTVYNSKCYFGLGDYIRGVIHLYQNMNDKSIFVNYEDNEIAHYLYNANNNNHSYIQDKIVSTDQTNYAINIFNTENYLYHNATISYPIDKGILEKVKNIFTMKPDFKVHFNKTLTDSGLVDGSFAVLHMRFDDPIFDNDIVKDVQLLTDFINETIIPKWGNNVLILSNSKLTKLDLVDKYKFNQFNTEPVHTGAVNGYDPSKIKGTLVEFFAMTKCKEIYQYCEIKNQVSGFSQRVSEIYDIPMTCIQKLDFAM
jgi:hypothetical protein